MKYIRPAQAAALLSSRRNPGSGRRPPVFSEVAGRFTRHFFKYRAEIGG
jgi:hypothetical protein